MTAVNWLDEQLQDTMSFQYGFIDGVRKVIIPLEDYMKLKQEAIELEKQQIIDAWHKGYDNQSPMIDEENCGQTYYTSTYGSKGSDETKTI